MGQIFMFFLQNLKVLTNRASIEERDWHIRPLELQVGDLVLRICILLANII